MSASRSRISCSMVSFRYSHDKAPVGVYPYTVVVEYFSQRIFHVKILTRSRVEGLSGLTTMTGLGFGGRGTVDFVSAIYRAEAWGEHFYLPGACSRRRLIRLFVPFSMISCFKSCSRGLPSMPNISRLNR